MAPSESMIPFNDLTLIQRLHAEEYRSAVQRVIESGWYILGPELQNFEETFAAYHHVKYAVGVATGTDAIELALRAADVGPGDEVITVAHTAVATICAVERAGATPVLVDIEKDTYTMDPAAAAAAITPRTKAIVPVHIYGHPADLQSLSKIAERHGLLLLEDCAQAHGAKLDGRKVGTFGQMGAFSFYPTKNLGACGDAGAVITNDRHLADRMRRLRNYGQISRYEHSERGVNSRLDEIQAALLAVRLPHLDDYNALRRELADIYSNGELPVSTPIEREGAEHVYHLYVIRHSSRDSLRQALHEKGIGTLIHYPVPVHRQPAYEDLGYTEGSLPTTETICREILSLPIYVGLQNDDARIVAGAIREHIAYLEP